MSFHDLGTLRAFRFESLEYPGLTHAIFTRHGGVSGGIWQSLNVGGTVGDDPEHVHENRRRMLDAAGRKPDSVFDVWQIHSGDVLVAEGPRRDAPIGKADGILTDRPAVTLVMRFADCVPVLLFDPERPAIGLVHAGWKGTVRKVVLHAVRQMAASFGSRPESLIVGLGPAVAGHHYPVGPDVIEAVRTSLGSHADAVLSSSNGKVTFDLWEANRRLLSDEGVVNIEVSRICTACHLDDWYSHRGEAGKTGRFGAVISLDG